MVLPCVLQRPRNNKPRTLIATISCRTLFDDDERLDELDAALSEKHIDFCTLQETRCDGFFVTPTINFDIHTFGECSGQRGVGFAIHKRYSHLIKTACGVSDTDGRIMLIDILLHNNNHATTIICSYSPHNTSSATVRRKFYSHLDKLVTCNTWLYW